MKNRSSSITLFSSIQWLFFIFANTVVVPISIGIEIFIKLMKFWENLKINIEIGNLR